MFIKCSLIKNFAGEIEHFKMLAMLTKAFPGAWSHRAESVPTVITRQFLMSYTDAVRWAGNSHRLTVRSRFSAGVKGRLVRKTGGPQGLPPTSGMKQGGRTVWETILQCHCPRGVTPALAVRVSFPPLSSRTFSEP